MQDVVCMIDAVGSWLWPVVVGESSSSLPNLLFFLRKKLLWLGFGIIDDVQCSMLALSLPRHKSHKNNHPSESTIIRVSLCIVVIIYL